MRPACLALRCCVSSWAFRANAMENTRRIWATVSAADAEALERVAAARGLRPADLLREAVSALIHARAPAGDASQLAPALTRLEAVAERLERTAMSTRIALDMGYAAEAERGTIREALNDIAMSVGVLAGSIEPPQTDKGGPF
jgi:hypothetical protein